MRRTAIQITHEERKNGTPKTFSGGRALIHYFNFCLWFVRAFSGVKLRLRHTCTCWCLFRAESAAHCRERAATGVAGIREGELPAQLGGGFFQLPFH
jgi:hypothetical protein